MTVDEHHRSATGPGRSPARHNAIVLSVVGAVTAALLLTVILAIASDGSSNAGTTNASEATSLDPRDQSIYDDGHRVGTSIGQIDTQNGNRTSDTTGLCNDFLDGGNLGSSAQVELYDHDDMSLWITGCVEGYEATE